MQPGAKTSPDNTLHKQMIQIEKLYQVSLERDDKFSVLKGFKNIIRELKSKLVNKSAEVKR